MAFFTNKKGITPLVATVLLVAFSVGLGALVMSWGQDYIAQKAEFVQGTAEVHSGCDAAKIDVIKITGQQQACVSPSGIQVLIDNGPDIDVFNIQARIAGSNSVDTVESVLTEPLIKGNAAKALIPYNPAVGSVLQVKLTPKIWTGKDSALCAQSAVTLERLPAC